MHLDYNFDVFWKYEYIIQTRIFLFFAFNMYYISIFVCVKISVIQSYRFLPQKFVTFDLYYFVSFKFWKQANVIGLMRFSRLIGFQNVYFVSLFYTAIYVLNVENFKIFLMLMFKFLAILNYLKIGFKRILNDKLELNGV